MAKPTLSRKCHSASDLCDRFAAESRDLVRRHQIDRCEAWRAGDRVLAALQEAGRRASRGALRQGRRSACAGWRRDAQAPLDPAAGGQCARRCPGTGSRAFWVGLVVVSLSVVSGAGDLPDPDQSDARSCRATRSSTSFCSSTCCWSIAMVAVIAVHAVGLWRAWEKKVAGARLHARIVAPVQPDRGAAGPAAGDRRHHHLLARARQLVQPADHVDRAATRSTWRTPTSTSTARSSAPTSSTWPRTSTMRRRRVAGDPRKFRELMFAQAGLRDLPVAYVVDAKGAVKVAVLEDEKIPYIAPPEHLIRAADGGQVPLLMPEGHLPRRGARQAAQLSGFLPLRRPRRRPRGRQASAPHGGRRAALREPAPGARRPEVRARPDVLHDLAHGAAGRHLGRAVVRRPFVAPIRRLISAAQQVTRGNLKVELPIRRGEGDLRRLSMNFNAMTKELERQRTDLVTANTPAHRAAPLHGGGALGRVGRRHRPRSPRSHHARQPLGGEAARAATAPSSSAARSPRPCRSSRPC